MNAHPRIKDQTGRIALVTGANRGLGFEACRQLAQCGFHVILTSRDKRQGKEAADALRAKGIEIAYHQLDVTRLGHIEKIREFVVDEYGHLDVLVNNAGVALDGEANVLEVPIETFAQTLAVNFYGPLHMTRAFISLMKAQNYGRTSYTLSASNRWHSRTPSIALTIQ
jgi:NAD(P)-dependent dehydrogenase (short-subunit alcohol dehydrogenase family)